MESGLTPNAIARMYRMGGSTDDPSFSPTIQIIHVKKIDNKGGGDERFKVSFFYVWVHLQNFDMTHDIIF